MFRLEQKRCVWYQSALPPWSFFQNEIIMFLETLILDMDYLIIQIRKVRGDLSDISALSATQLYNLEWAQTSSIWCRCQILWNAPEIKIEFVSIWSAGNITCRTVHLTWGVKSTTQNTKVYCDRFCIQLGDHAGICRNGVRSWLLFSHKQWSFFQN